jgi:hypothetical protein
MENGNKETTSFKGGVVVPLAVKTKMNTPAAREIIERTKFQLWYNLLEKRKEMIFTELSIAIEIERDMFKESIDRSFIVKLDFPSAQKLIYCLYVLVSHVSFYTFGPVHLT